jgi:putative transposase
MLPVATVCFSAECFAFRKSATGRSLPFNHLTCERPLLNPFWTLSLDNMLTDFEKKWDNDYQSFGLSWRRNWVRIIPFFDYPPEIRKVIYTTNAIESINMSLRKVIKTRSSFPTDEAVTKLFYLALRNISKKWTMPIRDWKVALNRFTIQFEERILTS